MKIIDLPADLDYDSLAGMLQEKFRIVKDARSQQVDDKLPRWEKNYAGIPMQAVRTSPFQRASNFMPQLIRMHSDILSSRVLGIMFGTKPFWMVKSLLQDEMPASMFSDLSDATNYTFETEQEWFPTCDSIINQSFQDGTVVLKQRWSEETSSVMAPNTDGEFDDVLTKKMEYDPVGFEDFWPYPITAKNSANAEICFNRIRFTKRSVEQRKTSKQWKPDAADLLFPEMRSSQAAQDMAEDSGITLSTDNDYPYSVIEAWLEYPVGDKIRPIVVVFNPQVRGKQSILKAYYNFMPEPKNIFIDFVPMPRKGSFYGYSVPEILEQSQEECAQIHNARRDANMIANVPGWKKKRYADVPNPSTEWYPGCVLELDDMDDLEPLAFGGNYNSMLDEEQFIMAWAEKLIGISPAMQGYGAGQSAGKRGVYATGATMALLSEGNQRLDIFIRRLRYPFHRIAGTTMQCYENFNPEYFQRFGKKGENILNALKSAKQNGRLLYDLTASDAGSNREVDRQNLLQMVNVIGPYYQQIVEAASTYQQIPEGNPVRDVLTQVLSGAHDLVSRILVAFNIGDRKRIAPDIAGLLAQTGGAPAGSDAGAPPNVQRSELEDILARTAAASGGIG